MKVVANTNKILKRNRLRLTNCRIAVLDGFISSEHALSHADLEKELKDKFDRVTIYRTLSSFVDRGILHKILDDSGGIKFALCSESCTAAFHTDNHIHFKCMKCGHTECLEDSQVPEFKVPKGYEISEIKFLLQGICNKCNINKG